MSAQRRTPTKQQSGGTATLASRRPAAAEPEARPEPVRTSKPIVDKTKAGVETARRSIIATRTESVRKLIRDSWSEMKKVNWPDRETTRNLTIVVIGISAVLGLMLGGIDWALVKLLDVF